MNVLIKGMNLPKSCIECTLSTEDSDCYYHWCVFEIWVATDEEEIPDTIPVDCPLVEVEEHTAFSNFDEKERKVYVSVD